MAFPDLMTSRLRLRAWRESDFESHVMWEADPRANEFLPFLNIPRTLDESREHVSRFLAAPAERRREWSREWALAMAEKPLPWWAVEVTDTAEVIGGIGFGDDTVESDFTPCVEIAWRFAPQYWGRGYATEAAKAVLRHGFTAMDLTEIFSMSALGNKRSFALMERIGLRYVKDFSNPLLPEGHRLRRYAMYKLTRTEWADFSSGRTTD